MAETSAMAITSGILTQSESLALQKFVRALLQTFPAQIHQLALFGSKARGDSSPDSDIDVLILVAQEDRALRSRMIDIASEVSLEYDVLVSPRVISEERWEKMRGFTLYQNILRDGIQLTLKRGKLNLMPNHFLTSV